MAIEPLTAVTVWWIIYIAGPDNVVPLFGSPRFTTREGCHAEALRAVDEGIIQLARGYVAICWPEPEK